MYRTAIQGFAATLSPAAAEALARDPSVRSITPDYPVRATAQTLPTGVDRIDADKNATAKIDGVDTRVNVDIAILDTGISAHPDLNVVGGTNCTGGTSYADDDGHETHVAGSAAAKDNSFGVVGVAPGARLYGVKVLDSGGNGNYSTLICGVDWVTARAGTIDVANMSLAGKVSPSTCASDPFHQAICNSVAAGVTYTVAAGNLGADASNFVPASFDEVIAVSALNDRDDTFASFSNYGSVIDIAAPGANILSTLNTGGYGYSSGTSMASPHVAGAAALVVASRGRIGPAAVKSDLQSTKQNIALPGDPDGTNECVLYVGNGFSTTPPPKATGSLPIVSAVRSASSTSPAYAYDDNPNTSWYTYTSSPPNAAYITFDLGQERSIGSVRYQFRLAGYADRFYIQVASAGGRYTTVATRGNPPAQETQTVNVATSARFVRFYFVNPNNDARLGFLAEVDIFGSMSASAADVSADESPTSTATPGDEAERSLRARTTATPVSTDGSAPPTPPIRLRGTATPAATAPTGPATDATNEANQGPCAAGRRARQSRCRLPRRQPRRRRSQRWKRRSARRPWWRTPVALVPTVAPHHPVMRRSLPSFPRVPSSP